MVMLNTTPPEQLSDDWVDEALELSQAGAWLTPQQRAAVYAFEMGWMRCHREMVSGRQQEVRDRVEATQAEIHRGARPAGQRFQP